MRPPSRHNDSLSSESTGTTREPRLIAGRYRILRVVGQGGFGTVFQAKDELEDREVALKVLRTYLKPTHRSNLPQKSRQGDEYEVDRDVALDRGRGFKQDSEKTQYRDGERSGKLVSNSNPIFDEGGELSLSEAESRSQALKEEFRLLTQLHHPNLASVYDFGWCEQVDSVYFTQEFVGGVNLSDFFGQETSPEVVVDIFLQLVQVLDYIHTLRWTHGDIKPSNILISTGEDGLPQARLIDFGLATMLRPSDDLSDGSIQSKRGIFQTNDLIVGTPGFSAPERVRGGAGDERSDLYSLAATLYTAVYGKRPFPGKGFKECLRAQRDWHPGLAGVLRSRCSDATAELIGRMLAFNAESRPQSARLISLELIRRESGHIRERYQSASERRQFARLLADHMPFVDRGRYLDLLLTRAAEVLVPPTAIRSRREPARARLIRTVVIEAPESMGKQRLLSELRREIQLEGALFVGGSFWEHDRTSLGPFSSIVIQLATAIGKSNPIYSKFFNLIRLAKRESVGERAAGQLMEFLAAVARERPFVLHLSDLDRAPGEVPRFLQLARSINHNGTPILFCVTTAPQHRLSSILSQLCRDQLAERWTLRPFTTREMATLLVGVLGEGPVIGDLVEMMDKLTGGHPLSFRETLRVLIEEAILIRDQNRWVLRVSSPATEGLHRTLAQRSRKQLESLGTEARFVANILFLFEAPLEESILSQLIEVSLSEFRRAVEGLESEGLIARHVQSADIQIALAHHSVRQAISEADAKELDGARLRLATRIARFRSSDPRLIFLRARLLDDVATKLECVDILEQSAAQLFDLGQSQLAVTLTERLIKRLRQHGGPAMLPKLLQAELVILQRGAGSLGDPPRETAHYEAGILIAEILGDFRSQSLFWLGLADFFDGNRHPDQAERCLERLAQAAKTAKFARDQVLELRIEKRQAEILLAMGAPEQAGIHARKAMEIQKIPGAEDADISQIVGVRLRCLAWFGQLDEARRLHDSVRETAKRTPVVQRMSYLSGITFLAVLGAEPERAIPELTHAIDQLRSANLARLLAIPLHNLGDLLIRKGDLAGARTAFEEALRLSGMFGFEIEYQLNRGFLGYLQCRMGNLRTGAALLEDARSAMQEMTGEYTALQQLRLLDAEVAFLSGSASRARRELEEMLAEFHTGNEISLAHWAQDALARVEKNTATGFLDSSLGGEHRTCSPDDDTVRTKPVRED